MQRVTEQIVTGLVILCLLLLSPLVCSIIFPVQAHQIYNNLMQALGDIGRAVAIGGIILFFTGLVLFVAHFIIEHKKNYRVIRPSAIRGHQAQAIIHNGVVVHLTTNNAQMDPAQSLAWIRQALQISSQAATLARKDYYIGESSPVPQLPAPEPTEAIADVVSYRTISGQVPDELSLLGIHPHNGDLEIISPEQLKTAWFVGGSNTGKTNTVYGKVGDAVRWGAKIIICDNHAHKKDSLANKLKDFHGRLLIPIAQTDEDIKRAIILFLSQFHQRRDSGASCAEKWLIVSDEVNATGAHVVRLTDEEEAWLIGCYGIKVEEHRVKLMVLFKILAETCGYESRGFEMFGFFISQKVAGLAWLRNAMMTVFVHGLLMESEALLAANNNRKLAQLVMKFKKGRTLVYGYEVDEMILQQPLYEPDPSLVVESTVSEPVSSATSDGDTPDQPGKQPDTTNAVELSQAQKMKLLKVLEMDAQRAGQNDIIRAVWGQEPNTRAGNAAAEELRLIRSFIAQEQRNKLGL